MPLYLLIPLIIALLLLALIFLIATRPAHFRIERSAQINAPAQTIFPLINDFHHWPLWSPWEKLDPTMKKTYTGPSSGPGSVYSWVGNKKVGEGRMTILDSTPPERITLKLEFFKPFTATNTAIFTLVPSTAATRVTWAMEGKNNFPAKAFSLLMNMDKLIGKDFEKGLANLSTTAQSPK